MDLYQKNPTTLRRLLNKRQNPCTQIFKPHPSNSTSVPMSAMDLNRNGVSSTQEEKFLSFNNTQDPNVPTFAPNFVNQSQFTQDVSYQVNTDSSSQQTEEDEESDPVPERVQKKIKTSMISTHNNLKTERKSSFEEEKDGSEHSTACDARSDFNTSNEAADFLLSPSAATPDYSSEIKLNCNEDTPIQSGLIHINLDSEGNYVPEETPSDCFTQKIKLRCKLNHQWEMDDNVRTCPRCQDLLNECREFARKNEGSCLNEEYDETVRYRCIKGHCWTLNYKNARRRWCAQCAKEQRNFMKQKCEEEKAEREKEEEEFQKKLFEEARKKAAAESQGQQQNFRPQQGTNNGTENKRGVNAMEYLQKIDYEIEMLAKKYTISFMSQKEFTGQCNYQQILQVYKILIMPEEVFQSYMFTLNADTLRSEFRRIAKIIHPDKNKHPQAGNAFQKIYKVYEIALSRLEGNQQQKI